MFVARAVKSGFSPSGMYLGSNFAVPTSYGTVTTWTADTGTYPGTTITSNGLNAQGAKVSATIASSCVVNNSGFAGYTCTLRLLVNGSVQVTGTGTTCNGQGNTTVTLSGTATVASGDNLTLQALASA